MTAVDAPLATLQPPRARVRGRARATRGHLVLAGLLYAFFAVFLVWPIVQVVATGFIEKGHGFSTRYLQLVFQDPELRRGLFNAATIAVAVTLCTLLVSLPLAMLSVRYDFPGRGLLSGLLLVPLVLPPFVGAIGMRLVLGRFGPLTQMLSGISHGLGGKGFNELGIDWLGRYKIAGIIAIEVMHLYPIMLLNLQAALANIDPAMEQAAANIGANRRTIFRRITLPLMRPGLFAGCTLVLIWSFTELGTPLMFDFYTITPVQVFHQITEVADNPLPYALVVVMLMASAVLYLVGKVLLGRGFDAATTKAGTGAGARRLTGWRGFAAGVPFILVILLALLPHFAVVTTSISGTGAWYKALLPARFTASHYGAALVDDLTLNSVKYSMLYASCATALAVIIALAAAIVVVRSDVPGRGLIDTLAMLPLAVPGIVLAFGYLAIAVWMKQKLGGGGGAWRKVFDVTEFPVVVIIIAYAARRLPYVVRSAIAGLQQTPRDLESAAENLGAKRLTVLRRITVPLILANLVAGALLAFAFAMLEVSDSLILAQRRDYFPITKAIWELSQRLGDGLYIASALGVWAMVFLTLAILSANTLLGKKLGAIFRI